MNRIITVVLLATSLLLPSCMADLRTALIEEEGITKTNEEKGRNLLAEAWKKQGFEYLDQHTTYSFHGFDTWKGLSGKLGKPWPHWKSEMDFKYAIGTFDGQVLFQNGKRKGVLAGLQSWQYYEKEPGDKLEFKAYNKRIAFGLSAYQYFVELLDRLRQAPIIAYAGEKDFNSHQYDLVFATWETPEPHMEHDQYVLYINKKTGMLDYAVYTLRDNYLKPPGYKSFYGSIHFSDYWSIEGVLIPHKQTVFLNAPKKKEKKYAHQMIVTDFQFDAFDVKELHPNPDITPVGDDKIAVD